jgi:hypothetical protein
MVTSKTRINKKTGTETWENLVKIRICCFSACDKDAEDPTAVQELVCSRAICWRSLVRMLMFVPLQSHDWTTGGLGVHVQSERTGFPVSGTIQLRPRTWE